MNQAEQNEQDTTSYEPPIVQGVVQRPARSAKKWFSRVGNIAEIGLFLAGSAALGGIAMVLWNRRLLTEMRSASEQAPEQYSLFDEEDLTKR